VRWASSAPNAIHPSQVPVLNELFLPSAEEASHASELVAAWDAAITEGRGAFEFRGRMVDPPVVARAEEVLRRRRNAIHKPTEINKRP
jgi:citrate lyase subunit beta/citryl-CoA lyase